MQVGVLDMGSNTFHMLVARAEGDRVVKVGAKKRMVRLGEATFGSGRLEGDAWERGLAAARKLATWGRWQSRHVTAVATAAIREAVDGLDFLAAVRKETGIKVEVLDGWEEAQLVLNGARAMLPDEPGRICVVDVGGGSTEIVAGRSAADFSASLPIGVLRLREEILDDDGVLRPKDAELVRGRVLRAAFSAAQAVRKISPDTLVFSSGTARALVALADRLEISGEVHGWLTRRTAAALHANLLHLTPAKISRLGVPSGREDTIGVGAVMVHTLLEMLGAPGARVSSGALRFGVAAREIARLS